MATPKQPYFVPSAGKDVAFLQRAATESSDLYNREITVKFLDREKTPVDDLYGESKNEKYDEVFVRANVELKPKKAVLKKMGIDEPRDLLVYINVGIIARDLPRVPSETDLFIVEDEPYKILDQQKWDYDWHTEVHQSWAFSCERLRPRSVADQTPIDPVANPGGPQEIKVHSDSDFPGEGC